MRLARSRRRSTRTLERATAASRPAAARRRRRVSSSDSSEDDDPTSPTSSERVAHEHAARALLARARGANLCSGRKDRRATARRSRGGARASLGGGDDGGLGFRSGTVRHFSLRRLSRPSGPPPAARAACPRPRRPRGARTGTAAKQRQRGVGGRTRAVFLGGRRGDAPSPGGVAGPGVFRFRARGARARRPKRGMGTAPFGAGGRRCARGTARARVARATRDARRRSPEATRLVRSKRAKQEPASRRTI